MRTKSSSLKTVALLALSCLSGSSFAQPGHQGLPTSTQGSEPAADPSPQSPQSPQAPTHELLDGVAAIVGDEIVTYSEIEFSRQQEASAGRTVERGVILDRRIRELLKSQAGRTLVVDRELVKLQIDSRWRDEVEARGGAVQTSAALAAGAMTPMRLREIWRDALYAQVWEDSVTGAGSGASGRPIIDRYIRPGQCLAFHRILSNSPNPADRARVGGRPAQALIQQLVLPASEYGGVDDTRTFGDELSQLASSGRSDFGDLVARYGASGTRETRGQGAPISMAEMEQLSVTRHRTRALLNFVTSSEPGDISEPFLGWKPGSDVQAIFVYKLIEHLPAREAKEYTDPTVQKNLERELLAQFDRVRVDIALQDAYKSSFSWTSGQGQANQGDPQAPPD